MEQTSREDEHKVASRLSVLASLLLIAVTDHGRGNVCENENTALRNSKANQHLLDEIHS